MKSLVSRMFAISLMIFSCATTAQGVYVTRGENGPVFSDKPQPGAREMTLKPLTVVPAPQETAPVTGKAAGANSAREVRKTESHAPAALPVYRSLSIVMPENNGSVAGDTSSLEVRLASDPPLLLAEGHSFVVRVNGRFVDQRFTATEFMIPPDFWAEGFLPANQSMQIEASIVDAAGQVLMRAGPSLFHTRQLVIHQGYQGYPPRYPGYHGLPPAVRPGGGQHKPKPAPKPKEEAAAVTRKKLD